MSLAGCSMTSGARRSMCSTRLSSRRRRGRGCLGAWSRYRSRSAAEIQAWQRGAGVTLTPWEFHLLRRISREYVAEHGAASDPAGRLRGRRDRAPSDERRWPGIFGTFCGAKAEKMNGNAVASVTTPFYPRCSRGRWPRSTSSHLQASPTTLGIGLLPVR